MRMTDVITSLFGPFLDLKPIPCLRFSFFISRLGMVTWDLSFKSTNVGAPLSNCKNWKLLRG